MLGLMFVFAGMVFVAIAIYVIRRDKRYIQESTVISGRVLGIKEKRVISSNGAASTIYIPTVEYYEMGKTWRFEGDNQGPGHTLQVGQAVSIRIQKGNHKIARLEKDIQSLNTIIYLFLPLGLVAVIAGLAIFKPSEFSLHLSLSSSMQWLPVIAALIYVVMRAWSSISPLLNGSSLPEFEESEEVKGSASD